MDPGPHSHVVDQRTCSSERLAEDQAGRRRRPRRIEAQARQALEEAADGGVRLQAREVHPDADVRARARRRGAGARSRGATSKRSGSANTAGSRLAAATETRDEVAARGSRRRRARRRASRSGRPSPRRARAAATPRSRWAAARVAPRRARAGPDATAGARSRWRSCPRSSRCRRRAAPRRWRRPRALEAAGRAGGRSSDEPGRRRATAPIGRAAASANAARPAAGTSPPAVTSVTAATIASYQPRTAPVSASASPSACGHDRRGERAGEAAPQLGRARAARSRRSSRSTSSATSVREALPHRRRRRNGRANGARWRVVLGAVEREHARADHLPGREARVVDGERLGVAHHLQREVAARDEPAVQRRQPRHRLALAQPGEQRMSVGRRQGLDGDCDLLVIGGGVMGLFTAYHASERFGRVVVLERGRIGDPMTASYGRTRSFRNDYLDATYARLAHEAFRLWGDFELQTATRAPRALRLPEHRQALGHPRPGRHLRAAEPRDAGAPRPARPSPSTAPRCAAASPTSTPTWGASTSTAGVVDLPAVTGALTRALAERGVAACSRASRRPRSSATATAAASPPTPASSPRDRSSSPPGTARTTSWRCCPAARCSVPLTKDRPSEAKYFVPPAGRARALHRGRHAGDRLPRHRDLLPPDRRRARRRREDRLLQPARHAARAPRRSTASRSFVEQCMPGLRDAEVSDVEDVDQCDYDLVADDDFVLGADPGRRQRVRRRRLARHRLQVRALGGARARRARRSRAAPSTTSPASTRAVSSQKGGPRWRVRRSGPCSSVSLTASSLGAEGYVFELERRGYVKAGPVRPRGDPRRARRAAPAAPRVPARGRPTSWSR